jgi:hypothetical protein
MNNLNADFLLDIWADLKAKRLAPIAVGLAVALVAMPALMLKGEETPTAGPLPIVPAASSDGAEVQLAEELAEDGSSLDSYKARDPFDGLVKPQEGSGGSGTAVAPGDAADGGADEIAKALGGGSPLSGDEGSSPSLGSGGGLTTGGGSPEPPVSVKRPDSKYTYQLDVKFGRPGREKRYRSLSRMSFLPNADVPALLFMGVPVDANSALFFVHPSLSHAGEGECIPNKAECNFLELAVGREHFLSVNDYEFRIRLLDIKRVKLSEARRQRTQARKTARLRSGRGDGPLAGGAQGAGYDWPLLVDGIG